MTDEEAAQLNQYKRPRYAIGDRVQVDASIRVLHRWRGHVRSVNAIQTVQGTVATYLYKVEMDNHAWVSLAEDDLRPIAEEPTQP